VWSPYIVLDIHVRLTEIEAVDYGNLSRSDYMDYTDVALGLYAYTKTQFSETRSPSVALRQDKMLRPINTCK